MKVGVMVPHGNGEEMQGRFAAIRREGFSSCQLVSWDPALWTEENAQAVQTACRDTGVTLSAFWCGWAQRWGIFTADRKHWGWCRRRTGLPG